MIDTKPRVLSAASHGDDRPRTVALRPAAAVTVVKVPVSAGSIHGRVAASALLAFCVVYFLTSVTVGWRNTISDAHGFRQSQTAISVDTMLRGGPWLIYQTPVLGPPWTVPFEFPLYQWIVASVVWSTGFALEPTGRAVSVTFFLLTLWPTERLLAALRVSLSCRLIVLSLLISSPFYIFWSRTFLIESTALFLATSSLACSIWAVRQPSLSRIAVVAAVSSLAAVVKITTLLPFLIASTTVIGYHVLHRDSVMKRAGRPRQGLLIIACACLPVLALLTWTHAADHAKAQSILGNRNTSTNLRAWNFGTLEQRLSAETWSVLADRTELPLGGRIPFAIAALGLVVARRRVAEVAACLLMYLVGILSFTNLFYVHDYYYFANNIFLIVAVGMVIVAMMETDRPVKSLAIAGLVLLLQSMAFEYNRTYRPVQAHNAMDRQRLGAAIRERTAPDDIIVLLGFEWSSEVPYYSERRAMCLPTWADPFQVGKCLMTLAPYRVGAVVISPPVDKPVPPEEVLALLRKQGFEVKPWPVDAPFELLLRDNQIDATDPLALRKPLSGRANNSVTPMIRSGHFR